MNGGQGGAANTEETTEDGLLGGRVRLVQPRRGFRAAIDPVLLAAAVPARPREHALDVGCGTGAAALCLAARVAGAVVTGIDLDPVLVGLARRGAEATGVADRVTFFAHEVGGAAPPGAPAGGFDHVLTNPPFAPAGRGTPSPDASRRRASEEGAVSLAGWIAFCLACLRDGGTLAVIHRADRAEEVLAALAPEAADAVLLPLVPRRGRPAKRVIIAARKGARGPTRRLDGLVLHEDTGGYTAEAEAILRDARAVVL